ncbi:sigma-70 family RNA polymerase sigma factor [Pedobacter metabolipauper]|uniref:RNA polymerase primary sigma factor n=1 Tax=Pedobacter metabolipauper TaxID=425513 RepID=A0A4R6ST73_9SPHI|nr:RNA polymerase sigma factor RpoD/SigA [Pedobacter metabolipauper]TDQ07615.1 RNA polymerase primary sigma factor [Pedobacter metabolipauper]
MKRFNKAISITERRDGSIALYLREINRYRILTPEEETRLCITIKGGDKNAVDKLVTANLRFVVSIAKQYQNRDLALMDLINEGNIGLMTAAVRFDHTRGFRFISFAVWWIRQSIIKAISENIRMVKIPGNQISGLAGALKVSQKLEQKLERMPTFAEISEIMGLSEYKISDFFHNGGLCVSLNSSAHQNSEITHFDTLINYETLCPEEQLLRESLLIDLNTMIQILPKREQFILKHCFGFDGCEILTPDEIAGMINRSKERTRQLKYEALNTLKCIYMHRNMIDHLRLAD